MYIVNTSDCLIDGFIFTNGTGYYGGSYGGGGAYTLNASAKFNNCQFLNNGGAGIESNQSKLIISNSYFSGNHSQCGGGISFNGSYGTVINCFFSNNKPVAGQSYMSGGAICSNTSTLSIHKCQFEKNQVFSTGGAIDAANTKATISNCNFINNTTNDGGSGGAIQMLFDSDFKIVNCSFIKNFAQSGAAINNYRSALTLTNCTIANNWAYYYGGIANRVNGVTSIANSIVWGNKSFYDARGDNLFDYDGNNAFNHFSVTNSLIGNYSSSGTSGTYPGAGNINSDPQFIDSSNYMLQLRSSSPAIDVADNNSYTGDINSDFDLNDHPRLVGNKIDMGAFEFYTSVCEGSTTGFSSNLTGTNYQWELNTGNGFASITNNSNFAGVNTASITINNIPASYNGSQFRCFVDGNYSTVFPVVVNPSKMPSVNIIADTTSICAGSLAHFKAIVANEGDGPKYEWKINGSITGFNLDNFSPKGLRNNDQVSVTLTSNASCLSDSTVQSNIITIKVIDTLLPTAIISVDKTTICNKETVSFNSVVTNGGDNPVYSWKLNGRDIGATTSMMSTDSLNDNSEVQLVIQSSAACLIRNTAESNIVVISVFDPPKANAGQDKTICAGTFATLGSTAMSDNAYSWSPAIGLSNSSTAEPSASPVETTTYTVTVTDSHGCKASDQILITVNNVPAAPSITAGGPTSFCAGSSVVLNSSASSNQWLKDGVLLTNATGNSYTATNSGSYSVYTTVNGCNSQPSLQIAVTSNAIPDAPSISQSSGLLSSSAADGNQWYLNGNVIQGATAANYSPLVSGIYSVKATRNGCSSNFSNEINFVVTGMNSPEFEKAIRIFPNPVHKKLFILYKGNPTLLSVTVTDLIGRKLYGEQTFRSQQEIDVSSWPIGIYFVILVNSKGECFQQMIMRQ